MVRIAIAGGTGNVGREIIDGLLEKGTHEILIFTRQESSSVVIPGVKVVQVDYYDTAGLTKHLQGIHTCLCFFIAHSDPEGKSQRNLIDACVAAGVKRYAPSEWGYKTGSGSKFYASKDKTARYLQELNKDKKVLEYSLFQIGHFLNYLAFPHKTTKHVEIFQNVWDFEKRRAIMPTDDNLKYTFTAVDDVVKVAVEAIDYSGEWPVMGGIAGTTLTGGELIKLGESIRGPFKVDRVSKEDVEANILNTSWVPQTDHPSVPVEMRIPLAKEITLSCLTSAYSGAIAVSDEWNQLLPHIQSTKAEKWLAEMWKDDK